MRLFLIFFCCVWSCLGYAQHKSTVSVIPEPMSLEVMNGNLILDQTVFIKYQKPEEEQVAQLFQKFLKSNYAFELRRYTGNEKGNTIDFVLDESMKDEAYHIDIDNEGAKIKGSTSGLFYALQTLQQLMPLDRNQSLYLPYVKIDDEPRFAYRGLMLDVGRYFFSTDYLKKFIDLMAQYKLNVFHWHLTEDAGWRIEIKKYPRLTAIGSKRAGTQTGHKPEDFDPTPHEGYYTQEEAKEIVAYAKERNITVIPEFDMPGHTMSVLAAYPEFGCTDGPFEVPVKWGIKEDVLCVGKEETYAFVNDVLDELIAIFPSPYIHIGGDEAPKSRWKECVTCQQRMKEEGLKDEEELQSYFIHRVEKYINSKGRNIIGWDEILEGGLAPNATVMSWRGEEGGIAAAKQGHEVIMTPNNYLYLDYYQSKDHEAEPVNIGGDLPLSKVYSYEPFTEKLHLDEQKFIKGIQGNVWMEYIHTEDKVDYMTWPRALALAEIAWSPSTKKDYNHFINKLSKPLAHLDQQSIVFRIPEPLAFLNLADSTVTADNNQQVTVDLTPVVEGTRVFYTLDGSDPSLQQNEFTEPVFLNLTEGPITVKYFQVLPSGRKSAIYQMKYE
ncbi:family 20 glycosylhydrolase [Olivibacter sp. SDN3]|uniref:beta-N-acetylhexosaminidase n=1 Tax=Olivibacter sp. SDN3 TaxID=2764720 RepID=UPI0016518399|nr:family 20 glycosylhydrolase [Olivibacter sp. SDN3]QNL48370.1 family 20 glycosylhydrolase [Olivibacter sp. SDN3]